MSFSHLPQHQDLQNLAHQVQNQQSFASPQIGQRNLNNLFQQQQQQQQQHIPHQLQQQQLPQQQLQALLSNTAAHQAHIQSPTITIKEVWNDNFHQEFQVIRRLINQYNYISFSTEFPGILARPIGVFTSTHDYHYQTLRTNCDLLNLIQFGISLSDANGEKPDNIHSTWQFNFKFDLNSEMISNDAFESLVKTGIDFHDHQIRGINQFEFAELLTSSGLILFPDYHWSSFHAGYDFGFLIAMLTNNAMPLKEEDFVSKLNTFFPDIFDLKVLAKHLLNNREKDTNKLSLEVLADELNIPRSQLFVSTGGQALLSNLCFIELKNRIGSDENLKKFKGYIHGLTSEQKLFSNQGTYALSSSLIGHE